MFSLRKFQDIFINPEFPSNNSFNTCHRYKDKLNSHAELKLQSLSAVLLSFVHFDHAVIQLQCSVSLNQGLVLQRKKNIKQIYMLPGSVRNQVWASGRLYSIYAKKSKIYYLSCHLSFLHRAKVRNIPLSCSAGDYKSKLQLNRDRWGHCSIFLPISLHDPFWWLLYSSLCSHFITVLHKCIHLGMSPLGIGIWPPTPYLVVQGQIQWSPRWLQKGQKCMPVQIQEICSC